MMEGDFYDGDEPSSSSDESDLDMPLPSLGIKPLAASRASTTTPLDSVGTPMLSKTRRTSSFEPADLTGCKLDDIKLSPPPSPSASGGDDDEEWDVTETGEELAAQASEDAFEEDWEDVDNKVFDHATNTFKSIPSVVYKNESFRETVGAFIQTYTEKYTPSHDTKCKVLSTMQLLKFTAEFAFLFVKEPATELADQLAMKLLEMPLDEATSAARSELLAYFPEVTKQAYQRIRGASGSSNLSQEEASSNRKKMLSTPFDLSPSDEASAQSPSKGDRMSETLTLNTPSRAMEVTDGRNSISKQDYLVEEKPVVSDLSAQKHKRPSGFQQQQTTATLMTAGNPASIPMPIKQQITEPDPEALERKNSFKQEMTEIKSRWKEQQRDRDVQKQAPYKEESGLETTFRQMSLSPSQNQQQQQQKNNSLPNTSAAQSRPAPKGRPVPWRGVSPTTAGSLPSTSTRLTASVEPAHSSMKTTPKTTPAPNPPSQLDGIPPSPTRQFGKDSSKKMDWQPAIPSISSRRNTMDSPYGDSYADADVEDSDSD